MKVKPEDFPADYITRELAAKLFNQMFLEWAEKNNVCLHPQDQIRAKKLAWDFRECIWKCGVCEDELKSYQLVP